MWQGSLLKIWKSTYQFVSVLMSIVFCSIRNFQLGNMLPAGISMGLEEPLLFMEFWLWLSPPKPPLLLRPGKGFNGWGKGKKNLKTIKHKPHLYLERSGCYIPIPDDLWDATEVPLKRERMREQLFSVTTHAAYHNFPLQDLVWITRTPRQPAKLFPHMAHIWQSRLTVLHMCVWDRYGKGDVSH